jgi:hemerythrin-like domain-containing protein
MHPAEQIIRAEHGALDAVLATLSMMVAHSRRVDRPPDFTALRALLFYVDEFPERLHHRKESAHLFPLLRQRTPEADAVLDRLEEDHRQGEAAIRALEHDLLRWEMLGEPHRTAFERNLAQYIDFYRSHMAIEEKVLLPLAERALDDEDWTQLNQAFGANADPLTGHPAVGDYEPLFTRMAQLVPAPWGLADAPRNV